MAGDIRAARELLMLSLRMLTPDMEADEFDDLSDRDSDLIADFLARSTPKSARETSSTRKRSKTARKRERLPKSCGDSPTAH